MTLDALIMAAGGFIVALPFLGFPHSWDTVLYSLAGIAVIGCGIALRRRGNKPLTIYDTSAKKKSFVESVPHPKDESVETATATPTNPSRTAQAHEHA